MVEVSSPESTALQLSPPPPMARLSLNTICEPSIGILISVLVKRRLPRSEYDDEGSRSCKVED